MTEFGHTRRMCGAEVAGSKTTIFTAHPSRLFLTTSLGIGDAPFPVAHKRIGERRPVDASQRRSRSIKKAEQIRSVSGLVEEFATLP
jgi:hypothetical protein